MADLLQDHPRRVPYITNWWQNREILNTSPFSACLDESIACLVCPEDDSLSIFIASRRGPFQWIGVLKSEVGFRYIGQEATSSYVELYGKKIYSKMKSPLPGRLQRDGVDLINDMSNIWSLPLAPTHLNACPLNIGGRLCHSSQSRPLFCGDGIPLTNEAMVYQVWSAYCRTHGATLW
jgi:hypothetical protein